MADAATRVPALRDLLHLGLADVSSVASETRCIVLAIYEKPTAFLGLRS
jgi:hypothetical protein